MNLNRFFTVIIIILFTITLTSCFFPENFDATITINKNGTYEFSYDGTMIFLLARAKEVEFGKLPENIEQDMHDMVSELKEDDGFSKVKYIGNSKFDVVYKKKGALDKSFHFIASDAKIFSIYVKDTGIVLVEGREINKNDLEKIQALNIKVAGTLTIKTDAKVVSENSNNSRKVKKNYHSYKWKFQSVNDPVPKISIQIN